ncbi:hypothetical protein [Nitratireductor thuwali]|uniref:hypothetical protein n=1 Tax=Nitratireductor thuwali TaxID=2267699 RepID=UPI0030CECFF0
MFVIFTAPAGCATAQRPYIDPRPQFDAQGNLNRDTRGNHIGSHGIGCFVDDPSRFARSASYHMHGNLIYDSDGNYAGCHDEGCPVDDPARERIRATWKGTTAHA